MISEDSKELSENYDDEYTEVFAWGSDKYG